MGIYSNSPTMTWLSLTGISVTKGDEVFVVKDFKTNLKYIYWDYTNPYVFTATNVIKDRSTNVFQVAINDKGSFIEVPQEDIVVSYDGNSVQALSEHIWGLHEKDSEFTNKFVSVEQDINGITTTVGQHTEQMGVMQENISKVDQKADSINLSVQENKKEFNDNKEMMSLRENVNLSIINLNSSLGVFKSLLNDYFKDNLVGTNEKVQIQANIDIINEKRNAMLFEMDKVSSLMTSQSKPENVTKINQDKAKLNTALDNLISLVNTSISDNNIVPSEITTITNAFAKCNLTINDIKNTLDNMIFLGVGGKLSEEVANISIKSDEIKLSVTEVKETTESNISSLESTFNSSLNQVKQDLSKEIEDVSNSIGDLETTVTTTFLDGVLSDSEKITLKRSLDTLAIEKTDIDNEYNSIYNNASLTGTSKTNLKSAYDSYIIKYNTLVSSVTTVINKEENITTQDTTTINNAIAEYKTSLGNLSSKLNSALDNITDKKKSDAISSANAYADGIKSTLSKEIGDINTSVGDLTDTMNGAFKDGIISEAESKAISERIIQLDKEKLDLDKQYNIIYANTDISVSAKTNLSSAKTDYDNKYTTLKNSINSAIADKIVDTNEKNTIATNTTNYNNALSLLSQRLTEAIDSISTNKANTVDKKYSEILLTEDGIVSKVGKIETTVDGQETRISSAESSITQMAKDITLKVSAGDIASSINLNEQSVKINAEKIDLTGYATFTSLKTSGKTEIDGGNIMSNTLSINTLKSNNANPIIRLFPHEDMTGKSSYCAIDATSYNEEGQGSAIRFKWDSYNYIYQGRSKVAFYMEPREVGEAFAFTSGRDDSSVNYSQIYTRDGSLKFKSDGIYYADKKLAYYSDVSSPSWSNITGKPSTFTPSAHNHDYIYNSTYGLKCDSNGYILPYKSNEWIGKDKDSWKRISCTDLYYTTYNGISSKLIKSDIKYLQKEDVSTLSLTDDNVSREDFYNFIKDVNFTTFIYDTEKAETGIEVLNREVNQEELTCGFIMEDIETINNPVVDMIVKRTKNKDGSYSEHPVYNKHIDTGAYHNSIAIALQVEIEKRDKEIFELNDKVSELENRLKALEEAILNK